MKEEQEDSRKESSYCRESTAKVLDGEVQGELGSFGDQANLVETFDEKKKTSSGEPGDRDKNTERLGAERWGIKPGA